MNRATVAAPLLSFLLLLSLAPAGAEHVASGDVRWACGGGDHPHECGIAPIGGGPAAGAASKRDGSGSVYAEPSLTRNEWIDGDERVLGIVVDGQPRAYPVRMLDIHEVVNDRVGDTHFSVTYCPLCGSGITFRTDDPDVPGGFYTFSASGYLFQNDLVMWDPQTDTLWNQILGEPIGRLDADDEARSATRHMDHPEGRLDRIPTVVATWDGWQKDHPESLLLQPFFAPSRYSVGYGEGTDYQRNCAIGVSGDCEESIDGIHPKEQVLGIERDGASVAFSWRVVAGEPEGIAVHDLDGRQVVAGARPDGTTWAFDAGENRFSFDGQQWVDQDGDAWDLRTGRSTDGGRLEPLDGTILFWFAWTEHHEDTEVWQPSEGEPGALRVDNGKLPGFTIPIVAGMLALGAVAWRWRNR